MARFWHTFGLEGVLLSDDPSSSSYLTLFLDSSRKLLVRMPGIKASSAIQGRCALLLSHVTVSYLSVEALPLAVSVEKILCSILIELVFMARKSRSIRHVFVEQIMSFIPSLNEDRDRLDGFGQDLQVRSENPSPQGKFAHKMVDYSILYRPFDGQKLSYRCRLVATG